MAVNFVGRHANTPYYKFVAVETTPPTVTGVSVPSTWGSSASITISARDDSDIDAYAVTSTNSAPTSGWQASNRFTLTANGTYYAWARDKFGNVSAGKAFAVSRVDTAKPTISGVTVPTAWGVNNSIFINASDAGSGVTHYAYTQNNAVPASGWQTSPSFTLTSNGTFYAWARDAAGHVSAGKVFTVSKVDAVRPTVNNVALPTGWGTSNSVTVDASDVGSGVSGYAVTTSGIAPASGWQTGSRFTLDRNGTYYAWARDGAGNVSASRSFSISKVDTAKPVVNSVTMPSGWGVTAAVTANATAVGNVSEPRSFVVSKVDNVKPTVDAVDVPDVWAAFTTAKVQASDVGVGVTAYAVTETNAVPTTGWQTASSFKLVKNGTYYAWAKDKAGNVSAGAAFVVSKVDTVAPVVDDIELAGSWGTNSTVVLTASDVGIGVTDYAISDQKTPPVSGWQAGRIFTIARNGTYFAWAKDAAGNISEGRSFDISTVDTVAPVINGVDVPGEWGQTADLVVDASDGSSGVADYAMTSYNTAPASGWQSSATFTATRNGVYFFWARDAVGNVSASAEVVVTKVDAVKPVVNSISIPSEWGQNAGITVEATDEGSGLASYAVTRTSAPPAADAWQSSADFTLDANGSYYAWAKDDVGNVSAGRYFALNRVDLDAPVISRVNVSSQWGETTTASISASDSAGSGVASYAVTTGDTAPLPDSLEWQRSNSFAMVANGTFYAWAMDNAGNISESTAFVVGTVDADRPTIEEVKVPDVWAQSSTVEVVANDGGGSGITGYALGSLATAVPDRWQNNGRFVVTANGAYYAWVKDAVGNVAEPKAFTVSKVDFDKPIVSAELSAEWDTTATLTVTATDGEGSGVVSYALSQYASPPLTGWQDSSSFTLERNGVYYAWAKDAAGNISEPASITASSVDAGLPVVETVTVPGEWGKTAGITITATDEGSGVAAYAVTQSGAAPAGDDTLWQESSTFSLEANGMWYAWAKDKTGNVSRGRAFSVSRIDAVPPVLAKTEWSYQNTRATFRADDKNGSGVSGIYLSGELHTGSIINYAVPEGTKFIEVQAIDEVGNLSELTRERVPGWADILGTLTVEPVEFTDQNTKAVIKGSSTGLPVAGMVVNGDLRAGNPITYVIPRGTQFLEMQAQDTAGDRSAVFTVRVPGWSQEVGGIAVTGCTFADDSTTAHVIAEATGEHRVEGIIVNGEQLPGSAVTYPIPEGTRHLEMQAVNQDGDKSAVVIRRVPGWSQIVSTLSIADVTFGDYNTTATVSAVATGGDTVDGIFVNDAYIAGNPVVYKIPRHTDSLKLQAVNSAGDLSAIVNRKVPADISKSTLKVTIQQPGWTNAPSVRVKITAADRAGIAELLASTAEDDDDWEDIAVKKYITIRDDTTVYATATNEQGDTKTAEADIVCFDRESPTIHATLADKTVNIRAEDDKSGIEVIYVNNVEFRDNAIYGGKMTYPVPDGVAKVVLYARDKAGNQSNTVELPVITTVSAVPNLVLPAQPRPTPPTPPAIQPDPEPVEHALPDPEPLPEEDQPDELDSGMPLPPGTTTEGDEPPPDNPTEDAAKGVAAAAVGVAGLGAGAGVWWYRRRRALRPIPELELEDVTLEYDESEFGGTEDPLDKADEEVDENVDYVDFSHKAS